MNALRLSTIAVVVFGTNLTAQNAKPSPGLDIVARLYRDYAWEAVVENPVWHGHELLDQPRGVLSRYFDDGLVRLWLADRACEARTHEICRIDFVPMWDSQDPSGSFVDITPTDDSTLVQVELHHPFHPEPRHLNYRMVKTTSGWRIHDISLPGKWSLVDLLSKKP